MAHTLNRGVFNEPVDADALNLPDYHRIVEHPMDFQTIKAKVQGLQYEQLEPFISDVRLVFHNACIYNPATNHVHQAAKQVPITHARAHATHSPYPAARCCSSSRTN
jgi:hypothetical protein